MASGSTGTSANFYRTPPVRPVDPDWECQRSGDCCRLPDYVVMTTEEQAVVMAFAERTLPIARLVRANWETGPRPGFVQLVAGPCPFLEGRNQCLVHEVRPFNCRAFGCMRPEPEKEPLILAPANPMLEYGLIGCTNVRDRLMQSRVARRLWDKIQRKAQKWGLKHGWRQADANR